MPIEMTKDGATPWKMDLDGEALELFVAEITPAQALALRTLSHGAWRVGTLMMAVGEAIDVEVVCGLVFLARRQMGEDITYDAVVAQVERARSFSIDFGNEPSPGAGADGSAEIAGQDDDEDHSPEA